MALPFQISGLPSYPTSFPYPPSLAQPFMVGGTTSPYPSSLLALRGSGYTPYTQGLLTPAELTSRVAGIQSMVTPFESAGSAGLTGAATSGATGLGRLIPAFLRPAAGAAKFSAKGIGPGLGYTVAGDLASMGARAVLPNGKVEHVVSPALAGAGLGAGIGSVVPVLGTGLGAAAGAGLGALYGAFHKSGPKELRPVDDLRRAMQATGLTPEQQHQYIKYYSVLNSVGGDTKESRASSAASVKQAVLQQYLQSQQGGTGTHTYTPAEMAAMQAQTASFLKPYTDQATQTAQLAYNNTMSNLSNVPEQYRGVLSAGASNQLSAATRLANAYAAQAQLAPQASAFQAQQAQTQALAQQIMQQAYAQQLAGGGNAGIDLSALVGAGTGI